jgi:SAM-dependent methyltransferase
MSTPSADDPRREAPAVARNRDALLAVLRGMLPAQGLVLEVACGTGEHAVHIASTLPGLTWQPSDPSPEARASTDAWAAGVPNIRRALALDAASWPWPIGQADAVLCVNMIHIAPWAACLGLLRGAAATLPAGAPLILYGPYIRAGVPTAPSNLDFDASLKARNPAWGLRALEDVAAAAQGFTLEQVVGMPANNLTVMFRRTA